MTKIRTTPKMVVLRFADYQTRLSDGETRTGPADVYYSRADFEKSATHYGWGSGREPDDEVTHMGDKVPLLEVLYKSINPVRVRYL